MARYEFDGIDQLMAQLDADANTVMERIERGLYRGGDILAKAQREEAAATFKEPTGELAGKVKADRTIKRAGPDGRSIEVYARGTYKGKRGSARRAATVAFVLEYGRRNDMSANPWNRRANEKTGDAIGDAIHEEMFGK